MGTSDKPQIKSILLTYSSFCIENSWCKMEDSGGGISINENVPTVPISLGVSNSSSSASLQMSTISRAQGTHQTHSVKRAYYRTGDGDTETATCVSGPSREQDGRKGASTKGSDSCSDGATAEFHLALHTGCYCSGNGMKSLTLIATSSLVFFAWRSIKIA